VLGTERPGLVDSNPYFIKFLPHNPHKSMVQGTGIKCLRLAGLDMPPWGPRVKEHLFTRPVANPVFLMQGSFQSGPEKYLQVIR